MASAWSLPVIFVCENNLYAMGTRQSRIMNVENIADRAVAYGIPGVTVDGNDVLAVFEASQKAVDRARGGSGPTLIECKTYRHKGHSRVDPAKYRPKEEVEQWLARDPLKRFKEILLQNPDFSQPDVQEIEEKVAADIEDAVKFAVQSPYPAPEEALEDVYA
jgi:pyruvate dehydrogenase E1 component alpha subunit